MEHHNMMIRRGTSLAMTALLVMSLAGTPAMASQTSNAAASTQSVSTMAVGGAAILENMSQDSTDQSAEVSDTLGIGGAAILATISQSESSEIDTLMTQITGEDSSSTADAASTESNADTGDAQAESTSEKSSTAASETVSEKLLTAKVSGALNVRASASKNANLVGSLYRGCKATILKKKGSWYKIKSGKVVGWVHKSYVLTGKKANAYLKKVNPKVATVTGRWVNVRKKASTDSDVKLKVKEGSRFLVIKKYGDWVKVQITPNIEGWISADYVKIEKKAGNAITINAINVYTKRVEKLEAKRKKAAEAKAAAEAAAKAASSDSSGSSGSSGSSDSGTTSRSSTSASASDLDVLAAICDHEAGDSYEGCLAVANVVLNRVHSSAYPNTIKGVIYQSGQFMSESALAPYVARGSNSNAIQAAKDALNGKNNVGSRKSFRASWYAAGRNYPNSVEIGDNVFF